MFEVIFPPLRDADCQKVHKRGLFKIPTDKLIFFIVCAFHIKTNVLSAPKVRFAVIDLFGESSEA
jgi:hypothetical protein